MAEVIIDGVRYVPATEAAPSIEAIARGLMARFWGEIGPETDWREAASGVYVYVNDDRDGYPIESILADIAEKIGQQALDVALAGDAQEKAGTRPASYQERAGCRLDWESIGDQIMTKQEYEATIAELRERHEAFVRKIREQAGDERFTDAYSINRIIALCDAELGKEN